jgi:N-acetylneuraminic acid mutarotase
MVYWKGALYLYGGYYDESFLDLEQTTILRKYDLTSKTWSIRKSTEKLSVTDLDMVIYQDTLFAFQGYNLINSDVTDVYKINLNDDKSDWEIVKYSSQGANSEGSYATDSYGAKVWFFGGFAGERKRNDVITVDLCKHYLAKPVLLFETKSASYDSISPRAGHSLIHVADKLLTFGGRDGTTL